MDIDSVLKGHGIGVGGGSYIKSFQSGTISFVGESLKTIAISSVDMSKAIVRISIRPTTFYMYENIGVELATSTSIKLYSGTGRSSNAQVYWEVIEFNNVKSLQRGSTTIAAYADEGFAMATKNVAISTVNKNKTLLFTSIIGSADVANTIGLAIFKRQLTSNNNIEFILAKDNYASRTIYWQAIEFN